MIVKLLYNKKITSDLFSLFNRVQVT